MEVLRGVEGLDWSGVGWGRFTADHVYVHAHDKVHCHSNSGKPQRTEVSYFGRLFTITPPQRSRISDATFGELSCSTRTTSCLRRGAGRLECKKVCVNPVAFCCVCVCGVSSPSGAERSLYKDNR
jgi:hypothetical protein